MHGVMYRGNEFLMQLYALESYGVYFLHAMMPIFVFLRIASIHTYFL